MSGLARVREDVRLEDAPMTPLTCATCGAGVEARKASWDQTSVQWHAEALAACLERRASGAGSGPNGRVFTGCSALRDALREAAVRGDLPVVDEESVRRRS